jgi:hypothetical protein
MTHGEGDNDPLLSATLPQDPTYPLILFFKVTGTVIITFKDRQDLLTRVFRSRHGRHL